MHDVHWWCSYGYKCIRRRLISYTFVKMENIQLLKLQYVAAVAYQFVFQQQLNTHQVIRWRRGAKARNRWIIRDCSPLPRDKTHQVPGALGHRLKVSCHFTSPGFWCQVLRHAVPLAGSWEYPLCSGQRSSSWCVWQICWGGFDNPLHPRRMETSGWWFPQEVELTKSRCYHWWKTHHHQKAWQLWFPRFLDSKSAAFFALDTFLFPEVAYFQNSFISFSN